MPVVKFKTASDSLNVEKVEVVKKRVRKPKAPEATSQPVEESTTAPIEVVKKRVRKPKAPEATSQPVEESTPAPVEVVKKSKSPSAWQLHVKKTFEDNKGMPFNEVMTLAKSNYKK